MRFCCRGAVKGLSYISQHYTMTDGTRKEHCEYCENLAWGLVLALLGSLKDQCAHVLHAPMLPTRTSAPSGHHRFSLSASDDKPKSSPVIYRPRKCRPNRQAMIRLCRHEAMLWVYMALRLPKPIRDGRHQAKPLVKTFSQDVHIQLFPIQMIHFSHLPLSVVKDVF
jgi:hypothetical protein